MNNLASNLQDWILLLALIVGLAGTTMETLVKPFLHELVGRKDDLAGIKKTKHYDYFLRVVVFVIAYLEAYPFRADLDIFGVLGADGIPEFVGVILAAFIITFGSKQVHDAAKFFKVWGQSRVPGTEEKPAEVF